MTNVISLKQMRDARTACAARKSAASGMHTHGPEQAGAAMAGVRAGLDLAHIAARSQTHPSQVDAQLYLEHILRAASAARELLSATADEPVRKKLEMVCAEMAKVCPEHAAAFDAE